MHSFTGSLSLKTKMALAVTILFILFVIGYSLFTLSFFERTFTESISNQQRALVTSLADSIDGKLRIVQGVLKAAASAVPSQAFTDADLAQRFLDGRTGSKSPFDIVFFLLSKDGKLIAETPYMPARRGKDLSFREYYIRTIATGKPYISSPFPSSHRPGKPAICMTVPVFDARGNIKGILAGAFDLYGANFLAEVSKIKIGARGYLYITDSNRTMIVHPDRNRIMKFAVQPGINKFYDRAVAGFDGSGETINSSGIPMLSSSRHLHTVSWVLICNQPKSEAYAPLDTLKRHFFVVTAAGAAILLLITWLVMKQLMSPLVAVTRHVEHMPGKSGNERLIRSESHDEIGTLAVSFNTMVKALDSQQASLRENEEKFRLLADFTTDWEYWIDPRHRLVYSSPSCMAITGYRAEEFHHNPRLSSEIIHPDDRELFEKHRKRPNRGLQFNLIDYEELEFRIITKAGTIRWISHICRPIYGQDGAYLGLRVSNRDISGRKRAEEALHKQTLLLEQEVTKRQIAQQALAAKQLLLEALNSSLEKRVSQTVAELRQKDQLLIQQSRMAAMGEMISMIAHQWRQPLNNVGLIVQGLKNDSELGTFNETEMRSRCDMAMETVMFMSKTIDDFRNFFNYDKDKCTFNLSNVVKKSLEFVSVNFSNNNIDVDLQAEELIDAFGFPNEFSQVLLNILNNARDVLIERKIAAPTIRIRLSRENSRAVVTIEDNGQGINKEILPKIFDPYFSTKESGKGTGIGLYMSKVIIEQNMGGSLTARNIDGGAEFIIEIPAG